MDTNATTFAPADDGVTEAILCRWLGAAAPGDRLAYYRGFLAVDCDSSSDRLTQREKVELRRVARRAMLAAETGLAHLVQRRNGANDFTYFLVARTRPQPAEGSLDAILVEEPGAPRSASK
jgi:hypothetical protein